MAQIVGIYGLQGWGKSVLTTYFLLRAKSMGRKIACNYKLKGVDYTHINTVEDAQNIRNMDIGFDEFWEWAHARTSQTKINKTMMSICLKNRKRGNSVIYNSQLPRTIDVILKDVTNYRYLPQVITHEDGKKYVHYIAKDILGRYSEEMIVPFPVDYIGKYFDTYEEPNKPSDKKTLLEKGIGIEQDFKNAVKKCKGVKFVELIPNSGNGSTWSYDVIVYANNGVYAVDVKGSNNTRVYLMDYGKKLLDKIDNAIMHGATPFIAFPNNKYIRLGLSNAWYMHKLTKNGYLKRLNSQPFYNKLVKESKILSNFNFV